MPERDRTSPDIKAIQTIRQWLEEEIAGQGICPPLVKLFQQHRTADGSLDWSGNLANEVEMISFVTFKPNGRELLAQVTGSYVRMIVDAVNGHGPLTQVLILPDFRRNPDYDEFITQMKRNTLAQLVTTAWGVDTTRRGFIKAMDNRGQPRRTTYQVLDNGIDGLVQAAANLVEGAFGPVFFYGQEVTNRDIADFSGERGPKDRQKVLSRAPYYLAQSVNILRSSEIIGNLDRQKLYRRNSDLARETNLKNHENLMRRLRQR